MSSSPRLDGVLPAAAAAAPASAPIPIARTKPREEITVGSLGKTLSPIAQFAQDGLEVLPQLMLPPAAPLFVVAEETRDSGSKSSSDDESSSSTSSSGSDSSDDDEEDRLPSPKVAAAQIDLSSVVQGK